MNARSRRAWACSLVVAAATALPAQTEPGKPVPPAASAPAPAPVPAAPAQVERATALLRAHAARCLGKQVVLADYVQRRTTALVKEPLVSKGEFLFVRDPGVVVFFAKEPRLSTVRLAATTYEVYRPQKQQLERYFLDGPELAQGLFAVIGGDAERLLRDFVVVACSDVPGDGGQVLVRLVANAARVRERLPEIAITLRGKDAELAVVAYTDHAGDRVAIELQALRLDPPTRPSEVLVVPKGTTVVEHRVAASSK